MKKRDASQRLSNNNLLDSSEQALKHIHIGIKSGLKGNFKENIEFIIKKFRLCKGVICWCKKKRYKRVCCWGVERNQRTHSKTNFEYFR